MIYKKSKGDYLISTDKRKLENNFIYKFLSTESYWAKGITLDKVIRAIKGSVCFGVYYNNQQIGFARVVTDFTGFGYLADVFIVSEHRGKGLSKWLMKEILAHPELQGFRRWMLATDDAHKLYEKFGFKALKRPDQFMELHNTAISNY